MVDFEEMSYTTLQRAVKRKFDVVLPEKEDIMNIKEFERLEGDFGWSTLDVSGWYNIESCKDAMSRFGLTFNHCVLDDNLLILQRDNVNYTEIIRRKDKSVFTFEAFMDAVRKAKG